MSAMLTGTKRARPGDDRVKEPIITNSPWISKENMEALYGVERDRDRVSLAILVLQEKRLLPHFEKRRDITRSIPGFWTVTLMNSRHFQRHVQAADRAALANIEDVWVERDMAEPRCFSIEITFRENIFFTDLVLRKEFKHSPPRSLNPEPPDENGITDSMLGFCWEQHVNPLPVTIHWKSDDVNITKRFPLVADANQENLSSIFNWFEHPGDLWDLGLRIADSIFPSAHGYFLGEIEDSASESEDSTTEDEDSTDEGEGSASEGEGTASEGEGSASEDEP